MNALGPALINKVNGVTLAHGRITVNAESSAWASRVRFALADIEPALRAATPEFRELVVRVRPKRGS